MALDQKPVVVVPKTSDSSSFLDSLCGRIEQAFGIMKGSHAATKAAKLLELISSSIHQMI
jgi:hypothetical protein